MAHMRAPSPSAKLPSLRCTVSLPNLSSCTYAQSTVLNQRLLSVLTLCRHSKAASHLEGPCLMPCTRYTLHTVHDKHAIECMV